MSEVTTQPAAETTAPVDNSNQEVVQGEAKPTIQAMREKFKLKVDGEEFEDEVDLNDKEELRKRFQLSHAAKKRMGEAKAAEQKALDIVRQFEQDPESMLSRLGPKGREIAEKYLLKQIQDDMLSPQEKEARMTKAKLEKYEAKEKEDQDFKQKSVMEKKEAEYAQGFQTTIIAALNKSGLPKTPEMVKRMAATMAKNLELGLELTPEDLVSEVKSDVSKILKSIIGDSDGDQLINMFGPDVAKKIRMSDLKKLQEKQGQVFQRGSSNQSGGASKQDSARPMTMEEWKESVNKRISEK